MLYLYNTLTRKKGLFKPLDNDRVKMYVCGPTVYDYAHIGNARPVVVFDVLYRLLSHLYSHVLYARNITDIDDKIIEASLKTGEPVDSITERTTRAYHEDMDMLGALRPDIEPKATDHIPEMQDLVSILLERGYAYEAEGHVLFHVQALSSYGALSRCCQEEIIAGARVEVASYKKNPADFVLWKPSKEGQPGWDSPWGFGRPGWHLECSAMAHKYLGDSFDIHGGGQDLIFPHHENEIAQSWSAYPGEFARYWLHNGYLMVNGEKMSKSLGNFLTVRDVLSVAHPEVIRFCLLMTHYRQPLNWTESYLHQARESLDRFYGALRMVSDSDEDLGEMPSDIVSALCDDLNTPLAISKLHEIAGLLNKAESQKERQRLKETLLTGGSLLGILQVDPEVWFHGHEESLGLTKEAIESLIEKRTSARRSKNYGESDRIRDELEAQGVILEDSPSGTTWRRR